MKSAKVLSLILLLPTVGTTCPMFRGVLSAWKAGKHMFTSRRTYNSRWFGGSIAAATLATVGIAVAAKNNGSAVLGEGNKLNEHVPEHPEIGFNPGNSSYYLQLGAERGCFPYKWSELSSEALFEKCKDSGQFTDSVCNGLKDWRAKQDKCLHVLRSQLTVADIAKRRSLEEIQERFDQNAKKECEGCSNEFLKYYLGQLSFFIHKPTTSGSNGSVNIFLDENTPFPEVQTLLEKYGKEQHCRKSLR